MRKQTLVIMNGRTFEEYLIILGQRSIDYPQYPAEYLATKIEYFKECWKDGLSTYKALEMLYYEK